MDSDGQAELLAAAKSIRAALRVLKNDEQKEAFRLHVEVCKLVNRIKWGVVDGNDDNFRSASRQP
jgi:hypothetical protein